jgi:hypothetical protein
VKYSEHDLWDAVYAMIPPFQKAREAGVSLSLPTCHREAIIEYAVQSYNNSVNVREEYSLLIEAFNDLQEYGIYKFTKSDDRDSV